MSASAGCPSPIAFETIVAYWAGDLDVAQTDAVEEHVFACAACTATSARVAAISEKLRSLEPSIISAARLAELRAAGRHIDDNTVDPGQRTRVVFGPQDFIVHHLRGLELADVDRVGVVIRVDETDQILAEYPSAPFEMASGEVLIACQQHFRVFPPNIAFEVSTYARGEAKKVTRYVVEHTWVGA